MRSDPHGLAASLLRCAHCGAANRAYAAFCIACGEPVVEGEFPLAVPDGAPALRPYLLPVAVALAVAAVLAWMLLNWYQDETRVASYRRGAAAAAAYDWAAAATQFHAAAPYADAAARATQAEKTLRDQALLAQAATYASAA